MQMCQQRTSKRKSKIGKDKLSDFDCSLKHSRVSEKLCASCHEMSRPTLNSYACGLHVSNVVSLVIGEAFRESQLKIFEVVERIRTTLVEVDGVVHSGRMNLAALNQLVLEATLYPA